jgi:ubiquitin carboxyl-terminal hydrolase 36/42
VALPMQNYGSTCFFNAVMQCLTHTVPLRRMVAEGSHVKWCSKEAGSCFHCFYSAYVRSLDGSLEASQAALFSVLDFLPKIWQDYALGQQRDAAEFFALFLNTLLESSFAETPAAKYMLKEQRNVPIFKLFGSKVRSRVNCA